MPLASSGSLTLNEIHVEAGGTSGTACTINDLILEAYNPVLVKQLILIQAQPLK